MTKKAIIYSKYSTPLSSKGTINIYLQQAKLEEYCSGNNITIVAEFSDTDVVGSTLNRPNFLKLLEYVKQNKENIDYLLFTQWNVITRDSNDFMLIKQLFQDFEIKLLAIEESKDVTH